MKILVVGGDNHYASWINGEKSFLEPKLENVRNADIVYFTGGEDVDPSLYGQTKYKYTHSNPKRDQQERKFYSEAMNYGKFVIGTCRGAQFLTVLQNGGTLIQHVDGHANGNMHEITFNDGDRLLATSTHHQMMYPFNVGMSEILAWSTVPLAEEYFFNNSTSLTELPHLREPEIVYYRISHCLAIQPHPEMMRSNSELVIKLNVILQERMPNFDQIG